MYPQDEDFDPVAILMGTSEPKDAGLRAVELAVSRAGGRGGAFEAYAEQQAAAKVADPAKSQREGKYPWALWLDGEYHTVAPLDYGKQRSVFQTMLHRKAMDMGMVVKTERIKEEPHLLGFMYGRNKEELDDKWLALENLDPNNLGDVPLE